MVYSLEGFVLAGRLWGLASRGLLSSLGGGRSASFFHPEADRLFLYLRAPPLECSRVWGHLLHIGVEVGPL